MLFLILFYIEFRWFDTYVQDLEIDSPNLFVHLKPLNEPKFVYSIM